MVTKQCSTPRALNYSVNNFLKWIIDSGVSNHMTGDVSQISNYHKRSEKIFVKVINGNLSEIIGTRNVEITKDYVLKYVLYVPNLKSTLLSISKITEDRHCMVIFTHYNCLIQDSTSEKMIFNARGRKCPFYLEAKYAIILSS